MSESQNGAVVVAHDVTRRYGEGDTAVDALRGVTVEIAPAKATAVMGPSGSGKSTLMHILAGLDKPTSGSVGIAGTEITTLGDNDLTKLRREHIGFVFQFFNLLPMLDAKENILLPLTIAGEKPDDGVVRPARLGRRSRGPAVASPGGALRRTAAARRDRARAHLEADGAVRGRADGQPRLGRRARRSSSSSAARSTTTARRSSWSRTTRAPRPSRTACCSSPTARSCASSASATRTRSTR